jgi:hypothetical protein
MSDPDQTSALDWCSDSGEKREKFKDLIADLQAEQKARTVVRPGKDAPPPPSDDDSQLPF